MSKSIMLNVKPDFSMEAFAQKFADMYRGKGYDVNNAAFGEMQKITISKNDDGINHFLGLGEEAEVTCSLMGGKTLNLTIDTSGAWTMKIIAVAVGWFVCCIPGVTGVMGCMRQSNLSKNIGKDATMIMSAM